MSVNKVILVGRVGQTNIRQAGDRKVANFTLATNEVYKNKEGNYVESTEWHNITIWDRQAETVEKFVTKGTQLYVEGKIKTEKYTDKDGNERYMTRIAANTIQLLGSKPEGKAETPAPQAQKPKSTPLPMYDEGPTDDLPF